MFKKGDWVQDEANNIGIVLEDSHMGKSWVEFGEGVNAWKSQFENYRLQPTLPKTSLNGKAPSTLLTQSKVKSDGGSSDYYKFKVATRDESGKISGEVEVQVQDVVYGLVGGEWSLGNVIKACRRMWLDSQGGGKEGTNLNYDANKIIWFVEDYRDRNS